MVVKTWLRFENSVTLIATDELALVRFASSLLSIAVKTLFFACSSVFLIASVWYFTRETVLITSDKERIHASYSMKVLFLVQVDWYGGGEHVVWRFSLCERFEDSVLRLHFGEDKQLESRMS